GADLDQVVGEDPVSGPGPGAFEAVDAGPIPAISAFETADAAFGPGAPFHDAAEGFSMFFGASGRRGFTSAGDHHGRHTEVVKLLVDLGFAVAAVGGDRARCAPGAFLHPRHRGGPLRRGGRSALSPRV